MTLAWETDQNRGRSTFRAPGGAGLRHKLDGPAVMGEPGIPAGEVIGEVVIEDPGADLRHLVELSEGDATRRRGDPHLAGGAGGPSGARTVDLPRFWSVPEHARKGPQ
jgi:hypothetical protein